MSVAAEMAASYSAARTRLGFAPATGARVDRRKIPPAPLPRVLFMAPIVEVVEGATVEPCKAYEPAPLPTDDDIRTALETVDQSQWYAAVGAILKVFRENRDRLSGRCRDAHIVACRRAVAEYLHQRGWSYPRIGRLLERDHSSVIHLVNPERAKARRERMKMRARARKADKSEGSR